MSKPKKAKAYRKLPKLSMPVAVHQPPTQSISQSPKESFFENWKYAIASAVIFVILLIIGSILFKPPLDQQRIFWTEQPLNKTHPFSLLPGEQYTYSYLFSNNSMNLSYLIKGGGECTVIQILNSSGPPSCINSKGNDKNMSNLSLASPFLNIFRPWMLAITDNWHWSIVGKGELVGTEYIFDEINLSVVGKENLKGRIAYKVKMSDSTSSQPIYLWVDDEKRILLREVGPGYEVVLIKAPFSFEQ